MLLTKRGLRKEKDKTCSLEKKGGPNLKKMGATAWKKKWGK